MPWTPKKVLVVEDYGNNLLLTRDILRHDGYEVIEARNGHEAIRLARDIKIIAVTSFAMKRDRERILEAGFDDYIAKPLNTRELPLIVGKNLVEARGQGRETA